MHKIPFTIIAGLVLASCTDDASEAQTIDDAIHEQPNADAPAHAPDVAVPDTWHSRLSYSQIGAVLDDGFVITGYDEHSNPIGEIRIQNTGPDIVEITHSYPRPCDQAFPGSEDCADVLHVTVHLAEQWHDAWSNAPAALFSDRAAALAAKLPPDTEEGRIFCALSVAAASAACAGVALTGPIGAPGCALSSLVALCKCDTFHKAFPNVDWDELCS